MDEVLKKIYLKNGLIKPTKTFEEDQSMGKVIYEVIRITKGKPLFYSMHYERFINTLKLSSSRFTIKKSWLREMIQRLIDENKIGSGNIKITFNMENEDISLYVIRHKYPTLKMYSQGVPCILYFGERQNPNAKVIDNDFRQKVTEQINTREMYEAILVDRNGLITEGSKSNIFLIKDNKIYTSKVKDVLQGVTRTEIINMCKKSNIQLIEEDIRYINVPEFDAMFISGTSPHILPISRVEEHEFDTKNKVLKELMKLFKEHINKYFELEE